MAMASKRGFAFITGAHKYGAKKTEYKGVLYDSKREAAYAQELDWRVRAGELIGWERQIRFELIINGTKIGRYTIDFLEINKDGSKMHTEIKGYKTPEWVLRNKVFRALYPEVPYAVVS